MSSVIPDVTTTVKDGGLGIVPINTDNVVALAGVCSSGTANTPQYFSDPTAMKAALGTGPLVEAAAHVLTVSGQQVVCCKTATSSAGTNGSVTNAGTGTSAITLSGTPLDSYAAQVLIVAGSTGPLTGVATLQYSLDGGTTWSGTYSLPSGGAFAIPNTGLTATFATGTLVAGDVYSWASVGPTFNTTDLGTALDALLNDSSTYFLVYVVGTPTNGTAGAAISALLESKLLGAATTLFRYVRGLVNVEDDTDTNIKANYAAAGFTRTMLAAGYEKVVSQISGAQFKRPASQVVAARAAAVSPAQDLAAVEDGPLPGVTLLYRDEQKTPGLDQARFATLRTFVGLKGFYITNPRILAPVGSDFQYLQYGRVMDIACTLNRFALLFYASKSTRVNRVTGLIIEQDALAIERRVAGIVRTGTTAKGYATDIQVVLDRTVNLLSTSRLSTRLRVIPLGYTKYIDTEVSFFNPALTPV